MAAPGWLSRSAAEVPDSDAWLGPRERAVQAGLTAARRRADWRLGRWTAKAALAAWLEAPPGGVEVLAAPDGAPEAWAGEARLPVSLSLSHRAGRAMALVAAAGDGPVGCDIERVEARSDAFVRDWLAPAEQAYVAAQPTPLARALAANLCWAAKEAAAKVRREGLRLDVRDAVVEAGAAPPARAWAPLTIAWVSEGIVVSGFWRRDGAWLAVAAGLRRPPLPLLANGPDALRAHEVGSTDHA